MTYKISFKCAVNLLNFPHIPAYIKIFFSTDDHWNWAEFQNGFALTCRVV